MLGEISIPLPKEQKAQATVRMDESGTYEYGRMYLAIREANVALENLAKATLLIPL